MKNDQMPDGFLATREGGTVRIQLPEMVVTQSHVFEPMLTRGAAQRVAEALWNTDVESPIERVVIVRDPRYSEQAVEKFRERVWAVLVEGGVDTQLDIEVETLATEESPPPEPPASPTNGPAKHASAGSGGSAPAEQAPEPARKAFVAPVSTRKKLDRGKR